MTDETARGITGDRRQSVPGFTEEQVWAMNVVAERAAQRVLEKFVSGGCHIPCALKTVVCGSEDGKVTGLDATVARHERELQELLDNIKWSKRLIYGAFASGTVAFIVAITQLALLGK